MSKQVTLENLLPGGFGLPTGQVIPGRGSIVVEPEIWNASKDHPVVAAQVKAGAIIVDGKGRKKPEASDERDENGDTAEMAEMRKRFDDAFAAVTTELEAEKAKNADLQAKLDALKKGGEQTGMKAEHHGGGKFNVTHGETVLLSGLSKADAESFNAMSDADKAKFVEAEKAKA